MLRHTFCNLFADIHDRYGREIPTSLDKPNSRVVFNNHNCPMRYPLYRDITP